MSKKMSVVIPKILFHTKYLKEWITYTNSKLEYLEKISRLVYKYVKLFFQKYNLSKGHSKLMNLSGNIFMNLWW